MKITSKNYIKKYSIIICFIAVIFVSALCFIFTQYINYKIVALILLLTLSIFASIFEILPVLFAATLSALLLNFFFIPPLFTFHIAGTDDILMFLIFYIVAIVNAVLTYRIRKVQNEARDKKEKEKVILLYQTLFNSLSHELKTPIATIIGSVDTLRNNNIHIDNQNILFTEIENASLRLNTQVENLLNMSRLETGLLQLTLDWCDLNDFITTIINKTEYKHHSQTLIFKINDELPLIKIDIGIMTHVIENILRNAFLYTPKDSIICISTKEYKDEIDIIIEDNGSGFSEEEKKKIFNKFYRLPNTKTGGSGLGLSIAKGFVEAHNGTITIENSTKNGAKFRIKLPLELESYNFNKLNHE